MAVRIAPQANRFVAMVLKGTLKEELLKEAC